MQRCQLLLESVIGVPVLKTGKLLTAPLHHIPK